MLGTEREELGTSKVLHFVRVEENDLRFYSCSLCKRLDNALKRYVAIRANIEVLLDSRCVSRHLQ